MTTALARAERAASRGELDLDDLEHQRALAHCARADLRVLYDLLRRTPERVELRTIIAWPREMHGAAYLWDRSYLDGHEDAPPPWRT